MMRIGSKNMMILNEKRIFFKWRSNDWSEIWRGLKMNMNR